MKRKKENKEEMESFVLEDKVSKFRGSTEYHEMVVAERYYRNLSDVQNKTVAVSQNSNTKIEHPLLYKLIKQKVNYITAKPFTIKSENEQYTKELEMLFNRKFKKQIKQVVRNALKHGIAWLLPYFEENELKFSVLSALEVTPLWKDSEHTQLEAIIRQYTDPNENEFMEYWHKKGVDIYAKNASGAWVLIEQKPHFMQFDTLGKGKPYSWGCVPVVWLKYGDEELPLLHWVKGFIDDINWQTSTTADVLRDIAKFIWVLKNYEGQGLDDFVKGLRDHFALKVGDDGGIDKIQPEIDVQGVLAFVDKQRRDAYDYSSCVDTKDKELGNASGVAIKFRYMDLDTDAHDIAGDLSEMFEALKIYIDTFLEMTGRGDFSSQEFDVIFNMDLPINELEVIQGLNQSVGLISKKTIVENHPYVTNAVEELKELEKEESQAYEELEAQNPYRQVEQKEEK